MTNLLSFLCMGAGVYGLVKISFLSSTAMKLAVLVLSLGLLVLAFILHEDKEKEEKKKK